MASSDKRGRMGSPLTHGTRVVDSHWPEQKPLPALSAGHDSVGPEGTACSVVRSGQCAQIVVVGELIGDTGSIGIRADIEDVVSSACDAHGDSSRRRKRRQSQRREGPFDGGFRCGQQLDPRSGKKHVVTAARMHGVVNERRTIDSESYPEYDPIQSAREKICCSTRGPLWKPNRVHELRQNFSLKARKCQASIGHGPGRIDFRRRAVAPCKRTAAVIFAGGFYLKCRG